MELDILQDGLSEDITQQFNASDIHYQLFDYSLGATDPASILPTLEQMQQSQMAIFILWGSSPSDCINILTAAANLSLINPRTEWIIHPSCSINANLTQLIVVNESLVLTLAELLRGQLYFQGSADSRFCIRLSGADVVLGGEPDQDIDDSRGCVVDRANAKGFAFEYMTSGRAVVLGDLGPWACAGMTGGRVYVRFNAFGIDRDAIQRRLGEGAKVELKDLDSEGLLDLDDLLNGYAKELRATGQDEEADRILDLSADATSNFLMVIPKKVQADPSISTE